MVDAETQRQVAPSSSARLPAVVKRLGWVSFLTDAASEMIYPLLPVFLVSIGGGPESLGAMEGIAEAVGAVVKRVAGNAADLRTHKKPLVIWGYAIATFVRPLIAFALAPWHVVLARAVDRVGKGIRSAPRDALLAEAVAPEGLGAAFGFHRMMDNAGSVLGPLLAFALARGLHVETRWIFAAAIVPGLASLAVLVLGVREKPALPDAPAPPRDVASPAPEPEPAAPRVLPGQVRRYLAVVGVFTLGASADTFLLLRLTDLGLAAAWIPLAWLSLSAAKSLSNLPGGRISDRYGRRATLAVAWIVYGAVYAVFPLTRSIAVTWLLLVAYGAYYGLAEGGERAIIADLAPRAVRGRAFGALHAVTGLSVLPANAIFGALYAKHVAFAFGASSACALLAAAGLALFVRLRAGRAE